ncbi:putative RING finger domain protein [Xylaria flabelliformis]|nr:putative RING finger domain protein [Xylaria flabelliformis]
MASRGHHLEPAEGREVVFCHSCRHEWYRDEHSGSIACPVCEMEFTEIVRAILPNCTMFLLTARQVTPESDPRRDDSSADSEPDQRFHSHHHRHHHRHDSDSDPEEGNIEEHHFHGPGGIFGQRTIHRSPETSGYSRRSRVRPGSSDDIIRRFTEMIGDLGGPGTVGRSGPETLFNEDDVGPHITYRTFRGPGFAGGVSSFTITTGSSAIRPRGPPGSEPQPGIDDPFQRIFGEILALGPPSPMRRENPFSRDADSNNDNNGNAGRPMDIATALNQLLASIVNPNAIHGDVVYSQEALDRIITNLMEANPQSNAPPPASENVIASLPKKKLDEKMLGPELKGECTICIDEVKVGDEVMVLPCKHWFHEECASLWLKQHNSCPVCRAAIDGAAAGKPRNETTSSQSSPRGDDPSSSSASTFAERRRANVRNRGEERLESIRSVATPYDRPRNRHRNSNSPPSHDSSAQRSPRVRSPSPSSRGSTQGERARDNRGSSGSGPFNWIRDRFSGR